GIYAISRLLGASYLHTPLARVRYQGVSALERNAIDPHFHRAFNDLCRIDSDAVPGDGFDEIQLGNITMPLAGWLAARVDAGATGGRPPLVRLVVPYGIADRFPGCYEVCKAISPFASCARDGGAVRIALHVRRGAAVLNPDRQLPNAYYVGVARRVARMLDARGIDYRIELHTETVGAEFIIPRGHAVPRRFVSSVISPEMGGGLDDFDRLPNLVRCINEPAVDCLRKLATADILVMSKSSFSYVAGILSPTGIVLYYPFWHSALPSWIAVDPDGRFERSRFGAAVGALANRLKQR